jgi:Flp pilus assembly protein TadG
MKIRMNKMSRRKRTDWLSICVPKSLLPAGLKGALCGRISFAIECEPNPLTSDLSMRSSKLKSGPPRRTLSQRLTRRNNEAGQTLVLAAFLLTVFMLAAGLAIDMGYLRYQKRRMQSAADSAALSAASGLATGIESSNAIGAAQTDGFTDTSLGGTATVNVACAATMPTSGGGFGACNTSTPYVQVTISQPQPTFFMRIVGTLSETVGATAVAEIGQGLGCLYALSTANDAITLGINGSHTIVAAPGCVISNNGGLIFAPGSLSHDVYATTVGVQSVIGSGFIQQQLIQGMTPGGDPLAYLPTPGGPGNCPNGQGASNYQQGTFQYPCGLNISAGYPGQSKTLIPGLYSIGGSGLSITGNGGLISGSGITFYVTGTGAVNINNTEVDAADNWGATVQLQAPVDGTYAGVLLFQDRSDSQLATVTLAGFSGGNPDSYLWGTLYAPDATLALTGPGFDNDQDIDIDKCSTVPRLTVVVAYQLAFLGNLNFDTNDCTWPPVVVPNSAIDYVPSPIKDAVLVQ